VDGYLELQDQKLQQEGWPFGLLPFYSTKILARVQRPPEDYTTSVEDARAAGFECYSHEDLKDEPDPELF
jgi:hypothetical protein